MKTWHNYTFARQHRRAFSFSVSIQSGSFLFDVILGRHCWALEVEW